MTQPADAIVALDALTAWDLMKEGGESIVADTSLREVVDRLLSGASRHLIVVDEDGCCLGAIGPRHIAQAHRLDARRDSEIPVRDLGCASWIALNPDDSLRTCAQMLVEHDLDAIPVLDAQRRVLGIVTAHDIARAVADAPGNAHPCWED